MKNHTTLILKYKCLHKRISSINRSIFPRFLIIKYVDVAVEEHWTNISMQWTRNLRNQGNYGIRAGAQ